MARGIQIKTNVLGSKVVSMDEALNQFIKRCEIRNLSKRTIKVYQEINTKFVEFCGNPLVSALNRSLVDDFILAARNKGNSDNYINTQLRQIRAFIYFCQKEYELKEFKIELLKITEDNKAPYTDKELRLLLEKPQTASFVEWREWALVNFFLGTGCRISTALDVQIKDIDWENKLIFFAHLKNRKQQYVPLSEALEKTLREYLSLWDAADDDYLFPTYERKHLSVRQAQDSLQQYNHKRGVITTGAHRFRHTFAKNYIINGGQALQLQQILGHSTLDMTRKYVNLYAVDLQRNFNNLCPLDNLM